MTEWWSINFAAIKDLLFYGYWLGLGMVGAIMTYGVAFNIAGKIKSLIFRE